MNVDVMEKRKKKDKQKNHSNSNQTWFNFFFFFLQERTVTIRRQTVGGFGLSIKVGYFFGLLFQITQKVSLYIVNFSGDKLYFRGLETIQQICSRKLASVTIWQPVATLPCGTEGNGKIIPLRFKPSSSLIRFDRRVEKCLQLHRLYFCSIAL